MASEFLKNKIKEREEELKKSNGTYKSPVVYDSSSNKTNRASQYLQRKAAEERARNPMFFTEGTGLARSPEEKAFIAAATDHIQPSPIYDYTGASRKNTSTQAASKQEIEYDSGSVLKLGAGPLSNNAVSQKVVSGELEITGASKDGKYTVAKNKNYVAPKKTADIIDVSKERQTELEAIKNPTKSQLEELASIKKARADRQKEIDKKAEEAKKREALEMGDNWFSWLGRSRDSTLPLSTAENEQAGVLGKTVGAGGENVVGSFINAAGRLLSSVWEGLQTQAALETAINAERRGEDFDEVFTDQLNKTVQVSKAKGQLFADTADILLGNAENLKQEAYEAAGKEGKFLVDLLYTGTQMAGDLAANMLVPGSGLALMATRVFGQSAYEARKNGADDATQLVTGLKSAVIEYLTEKLGGGALKKVYGAGIVDNAIESMLGRLLKTDKGRTVIRFLLECTGEGLEEVISDIANPIADRLLGLDDGEGAIITDEDISQMWYDFLLGTALGGMGSAVNLSAGSYTNQNEKLRDVEAAQRALIESGLESAEGTESRKLAEQYKKTLESGRMLSNRQVRKLTEANDAAIAEEIAEDSAASAVREASLSAKAAKLFNQLGEAASPELISGVTKLAGEGMPTEAEIQAIEHSENAALVARTLIHDSTGEQAQTEETQEKVIEEPQELWDADNIVESMFPNEVKNGILTAQDVADIQKTYDDTERTMDLNELKTMVKSYIENKNKEASNNGRGNDLDGSMGRQSGKSSGEQGEAVRSSAEGDKGAQSGGEHRADAGGESVRSTSGKKPKQEKVSGKSLNIPKGTDNKTLTVVKPSGVNERIVKTFSKASNGITLVNGKIEQQIGDEVISVTGMCTADGRVFACMNHPVYSGTKLLLHECGHLYIDSDTEMRKDMHAAALKIIKGSALEELANNYALLWKGLYDMPEGIKTDEDLAEYFDNNPDAYADFLETYEKEIWCDALAGLDRARAPGAAKLTDEIRSIFKEYTGIDVEALLVGKEATETELEETDGKNEPERPRNNSPPAAESYSINNTRDLSIKEQLKEFRAGKMSSHDEFYFGIAPRILNADGLAERPLVMSQTDLKKSRFEKHTVPTRAITRLSEILSDPILSFSSGTRIGILTKDIDGDGKPLLVAIARDVNLDNETVNRIKSAYGLDNPQAWLKNQIENKKALRIYDEKEADHFLDEFGYKAERPENFRSGDIVTASPKEVNSQNYSDSYSIDENLEYDLYTVYNDDFDSSRNEVHIGTASNFITKVIGAKGFDLYMPVNKAYQAMATEERAIFDGKPTGENINYHGLGVKGLMDILKKSETPIAAFADTPSRGNKRENRIVLVTDAEIDGGLGVVIVELETKARHEGVRVKANKAITAYPKANIENAIADAISDGRILHIDKKRSHMLRSGGKGANYPTAISEDGFANNIRRFWENVKWKNSGTESFTVESPQETEPEWKTKLRQFSEDSYSIDENLEYDLYTVYNDDFDSSRNEVHIGTASNFITKVIGAKGFDLYMPANKAYQAMATEERAIFDGKPTGENINYHGLGVKGLMDILKKSETPIAAYAAAPDEKGKRENRIVLVTGAEIDGGLGVVIEEIETYALKEGKRVKANKAITAYPKANIENAIADAMADGRILHIDKKRSHMLRSGVKGSNYPTAISEDGFTDNIRRFWENVKWKNSGTESFTVESPQETEPEWKTKLRQFSEDGYSADDEINYESLVSKPGMTLTTVKSLTGMSRADIVSAGENNAASVGYVNENGIPVIYVDDTGTEVRVTNKGLRHGLRRKYADNGTVTAKAGEILKNSIKINELAARESNPNGSDVLISAAREGQTLYIVRAIVSKGSNELEEMDTLYAIDTKKEPAALNAPGLTAMPLPVTDSKISIYDLLEYVNGYFPEVLPTEVLKHFGRETRPNSSISNSVRYSVDDALLVEGEAGYANALRTARERARRLSIAKLEAEINKFSGKISGYEQTEERTERMELELEDLCNRRKVYSEILEVKKKKREEQDEIRRKASKDAWKTAKSFVDENGRNISKHALTEQLFKDFSINKYADNVSETRDIINAFADEYAKAGKITRKDINQLFNCLMSTGEYIKIDHFAAEIRSELNGGFINVPSEVKNEFGSDWDEFYRRAFENGIYLRVDSGNRRIFEWTESLAKCFGKNEFNPDADLKTQLERIIELAEEGKAQNMNLFQMAEYVRNQNGQEAAEAILDDLYQKLEDALKAYAVSAKLEMNVKQKTAYRKAKDRSIRQENARRAQEKKAMRERQQETLKQLQILKKMRDTTSAEFREQIDRVLEGIDTIAISAANAMNYSEKYGAAWGSLVAMYEEAKRNDPNFLPDTYLDKLMERINGKHLADMEAADVEQLYQAAVALRTKIYNTQNIIGSETNMLFDEAYDSIRQEMREADKPKNRYGAKWKAMRYAMNPNHYLECLAGWNPDSVWFKTFAKGLENGERKMKRYVETSKQMLDDFVKTHKKWLEVADGQGKNGIWYEVEVSPVAEWLKGDQPIFGEPIKVYMTPLQKVHMYLESKNYDNLAHMLGGRVFADKELYSQGNKTEAWAADPIHLAPADVRRISSDLTEEEMELANILERYYNTYAKTEINKVSNELYGFDRAMSGNYAPIFTKETYNAFTPATLDGTAEGVGHMKTRIKGARTPTLNLSAMEAFEKHISQTSRFVGMAIPLHNMKSMLNWTQNGKSMRQVIEQEWSKADREYIEQLMTDLENPNFSDEGFIEERIDKIQAAYIGSVFGFNPSVALKVFGSWNLASAELGFENVKGAFAKVDPELIRKYTSEYDVRVRGYASPEVARLVNSQGRIEKIIQSNKVTKELFGGGLMIHTDALVARSIWAWSEAAVRNENPELEIGTQEQIDAGQSPFYKAVAERYNTAMGNTQSMYDVMHRSAMLRSEKAVDRAFTMFHTDIMQALNLLIKAKGEAAYYTNAAKENPDNEFYKEKSKRYEHSFRRAATAAVTSSLLVALVSTLNALLKRREDFYDENNKFMWGKLGADYIVYVLKDFAGMIPFGFEQAVGAVLDLLNGDKWYDVEIMGLSMFNDLVERCVNFAGAVVSGTAPAKDVKDMAFLVARLAGLPLDNVERYILGMFSWVSPEWGEAYNNMIEAPKKSDLKGKTGEVLERDIYDMYKGFGLDRETTDEIARLYELGFDKIIYGSTPDSITEDGTEYELDKDAKKRFELTKQETLSKLAEVIASNEYQSADDKERAGMLKRLNAYANETAKAAAVSEYDMPSWVESCKGLLDAGESIMSVASMPYTERASSSTSTDDNDPRYVKLIKAGVEYNNAREIEETLTMLLPEGNAKSVTQVQKVAAVAYMPIPEDEKSAAIELIYGAGSKKSYERYEIATNAGLSSVEYADFLTTLDRINDDSGVKQDEFKQAVRECNMPDYVAAQLWATYGWTSAYSRN